MIYFSEIKGRKVVTEDDVQIGVLEDIIFVASENPTITKIVVRGIKKERLSIPKIYIEKFNSVIIVAKEYIVASLDENELHLVKNLLDKQIIDLKGNKVVRVNDVAIQDKGPMYIAGVDIGILGILRWLKLEEPIYRLLVPFNIRLHSEFLSWGDIQPLELVHGEVKLRKIEEKLNRIRPEDLADYLEKTNIVNIRKFFKILDEKNVVEVISHLNLNYRASLFRHYKPQKAARLLGLIDPNEAVDILLTLPIKKRQQILDIVPESKQQEYTHLYQYSTTQIGGLLTSEYITVSPTDHVREVINVIRKQSADFYYLPYIYVVNEKKELTGVFNLHELLLQSDTETPVYRFMIQDVIVGHISTPAEILFNKLLKYSIEAVPIIDENKRIIGVVHLIGIAKLVVKNIQ